jgi:hypothetical protein
MFKWIRTPIIETHQLSVPANDVNLLEENKNSVMRNIEFLLEGS